MISLGAFGVGIGVAGLALGVAALPVLERICVRGDWFPPVKILADRFLVSTHCLSGFWLVEIGFRRALAFFGVGGVAVPGLAWALWGDLGCLFGSLCFVMCRSSDSECWWELMDGGTSSPYIFLFMSLLMESVEHQSK